MVFLKSGTSNELLRSASCEESCTNRGESTGPSITTTCPQHKYD
jgi:hypothetical protein